MVNVLWREGWLKPLLTESLPSEKCAKCNNNFRELDFVTSCEFCQTSILHENCCNLHIMEEHQDLLETKMAEHKEKRLHSFQ